ncbi:MAG: D-tyrosyl-tRNA(Tyr) deacylase [Blautia sp.]|nr:D-tyrosyl-tRNA(Tyr) deacylase [Blautia sp.]
MRFVIQVVSQAKVEVEGKIVGQIGKGYAVLVGVGREDTEAVADRMVKKLLGLRIFADENGKTNRSLADVNGEVLLVSQFTLYADCTHGNRPGFTNAGLPERANELYEYIIGKVKETVSVVEKGVFGADMHLTLTNEGPFTIILDSDELFPKKP